uniref:U5 small nuclear ribonucleoprotein TSSC4 n=1 Tax=Dendroctonus ponderosae TaxID=77166 RepID=J3JVA4_DENPD|nr:unknown [Dendroctonus ponderosae]
MSMECLPFARPNMDVFKLKTGNPEFKDRQKKVFDQLMVLENNRKNTNSSSDSAGGPRDDRSAQRSQTRAFRGKESIFKRPQNPAPKSYINKIPDFKKNPHKWTRYSLEDVQEVTEESNAKSAMEFLRELANRKKLEKGIVEEKLGELPSKIVFNKHIRLTETSGTAEPVMIMEKAPTSSEPAQKPSYKNAKLVMPEYVIGQKVAKKEKRSGKPKPVKGKELKLDHLMIEGD